MARGQACGDRRRPARAGRVRDPADRWRTGRVFDTEGHEAEALLIECARRFIAKEGLTGTDPESLAIAAADAPELKTALLAFRDG